ncbi:hypothetical protein M413DRAFT_88333 [Hebeloma cylindrosporum]|uniref:Uncharacterized protein n=1 Tax=Hebeloma cylindrosporum TaxID=76867 RepID=A0A0C2Z6R6_HEBCY|nr:hypothetical protein M413DRAFT_88333 [Hebeloma cylindrosporum h7]
MKSAVPRRNSLRLHPQPPRIPVPPSLNNLLISTRPYSSAIFRPRDFPAKKTSDGFRTPSQFHQSPTKPALIAAEDPSFSHRDILLPLLRSQSPQRRIPPHRPLHHP